MRRTMKTRIAAMAMAVAMGISNVPTTYLASEPVTESAAQEQADSAAQAQQEAEEAAAQKAAEEAQRASEEAARQAAQEAAAKAEAEAAQKASEEAAAKAAQEAAQQAAQSEQPGAAEPGETTPDGDGEKASDGGVKTEGETPAASEPDTQAQTGAKEEKSSDADSKKKEEKDQKEDKEETESETEKLVDELSLQKDNIKVTVSRTNGKQFKESTSLIVLSTEDMAADAAGQEAFRSSLLESALSDYIARYGLDPEKRDEYKERFLSLVPFVVFLQKEDGTRVEVGSANWKIEVANQETGAALAEGTQKIRIADYDPQYRASLKGEGEVLVTPNNGTGAYEARFVSAAPAFALIKMAVVTEPETEAETEAVTEETQDLEEATEAETESVTEALEDLEEETEDLEAVSEEETEGLEDVEEETEDDRMILTGEDEGIVVTITAAPGVLPEDTSIRVTKLEDSEALAIAQETGGETLDGVPFAQDAIGVDIAFIDGEGNEFEPAGAVEVAISLADYRALEADSELLAPAYELIHVPDEGAAEFVENAYVSENGAEFTSSEFSTYILSVSSISQVRLAAAASLDGYADYTPYLTTHKLEIDNKEIPYDGTATIEPSENFQLSLSFSMTMAQMAANVGANGSDGKHYSFVLPPHISIGDQGSSASPLTLYNSSNVAIGTYYVKDDVMYITFPGYYDSVVTNFAMSASWSDTEDLDEITVPWKDRVEKYKINRSSIILTKEQSHATRDSEGITRNNYTVTMKAKDDAGAVSNIDFTDKFTSQHMKIDEERYTSGGKKYAFKVTSYDSAGAVTGTTYYTASQVVKSTKKIGDDTVVTMQLTGLSIASAGKMTVEYSTYLTAEDKLVIDANGLTENLTNDAEATHPLTNPKTGKLEHPVVSASVDEHITPKAEWILKEAGNSAGYEQTGDDGDQKIIIPYVVTINKWRQYSLGGSVVKDEITGFNAADGPTKDVKYDTKGISKTPPYVIRQTNAGTTTIAQKWVELDAALYNRIKALAGKSGSVDVTALDRLRKDSALQSALIAAAGESGSVFTDDMAAKYVFTNADAHDFVWFVPKDGDDKATFSTWTIHYNTVAGEAVSGFQNSARLWYTDYDPVIGWGEGEPGNVGTTQKVLTATKSNNGVYTGADGNFYVDWTLTVGLPSNSAGFKDIWLVDRLPVYSYDGVTYSDWLKGVDYPDHEGLMAALANGAFQISTASKRADVKKIVSQATMGYSIPQFGGYTITYTEQYINGVMVELPDSEWLNKYPTIYGDQPHLIAESANLVYHADNLPAGQFISYRDDSWWGGSVVGETFSAANFTVNLGDFPSTRGQAGYDIVIKYTTQVNPVLVDKLPEILEAQNKEVATLTNSMSLYNSWVLTDKRGNPLGRVVENVFHPGEGYIDQVAASYWIGATTPGDYIQKDRKSDYNKGIVNYETTINKNNDLIATANEYVIQDAMNVSGLRFKANSINLTDANGNKIIVNGTVQSAYKSLVKVTETKSASASNSFTITLNNATGKFQTSAGKLVKMTLTYAADFSVNATPTDVTLLNTSTLSLKVPTSDGNSTSTRLIGQSHDEYTVDLALDKESTSTYVPTAENQYTSSYSIEINPQSANAYELANLKKGDTFTVRDVLSSKMVLDLNSIQVKQTVNGSTKNAKAKTAYNDATKTMDVTITVDDPNATYQIYYNVRLNQLILNSMEELTNTAEVVGSKIKKDTVVERVRVYDRSESADATINKIRVVKYDQDDVSKRLKATFDVYKWDTEHGSAHWTNLTSGSRPVHEPIKTDANGVAYMENQLVNDVPQMLVETWNWYKLVEIDTQTGYTLNTEPLYYYVSSNGRVQKKNSEGKWVANNPPAEVKNYTIATIAPVGTKDADLPTLYFSNRKVRFSLEKLDKGTSDPISGVDFTLYSDAAAKKPLVTKTTDEEGLATFADLTLSDGGNGVLYLKETSTPSGYLENNAIYALTFENGKIVSAVSTTDESDELKFTDQGVETRLTVTNTSITNRLEIGKKVVATSPSVTDSATFAFVITLTDPEGKELTKAYTAYKVNAAGKRTKTTYKSGTVLQLKNGERFLLEGIPTDTKYVAAEVADQNYTTRYSVEDSAGKDAKSSYNGTSAAGTVEQGSHDNITFTNTKKTSVTVFKHAATEDGMELAIPNGHTISIQANSSTGTVYARAIWNASKQVYEPDYLYSAQMGFFTTAEDGTKLVNGFRVTNIPTKDRVAVVESKANIDGYAYVLEYADGANPNCVWVNADQGDDRLTGLYNTYTSDFVETNIMVTKKLIGRPLKEGEFSFALRRKSGKDYTITEDVVTNKADASNNVDFGRLTFTSDDLDGAETKDFYYRIEEAYRTLDGISYDTNYVYVKLTLARKNGKLIISTPLYSSKDLSDPANTADGTKVFTNKYSAKGTLKLNGSKTVENGNDTVSKRYAFTVTEYTNSTYKTKKGTTAAATATTNTKNGGTSSFTFSDLSYALKVDESGKVVDENGNTIANTNKQAYTKNYYYIVTEDIPTGAEEKTVGGKKVFVKDGITYDGTQVKIRVEVKDLGQGKLEAIAYDEKGNQITEDSPVSFTNTYDAAGELPLAGKKTFQYQAIAADVFSVTVTEYTDENRTTIKKDDSKKNIVYTYKVPAAALDATKTIPAAVSDIPYGKLTYTLADVGTHYYTIKEVVPTKAADGIQYATNSYEIKVTVSDPGNGVLRISTVGSSNALNFTNVYQATGTYTIQGNKRIAGRNFKDGESYTFAVAVKKKSVTGTITQLTSKSFTATAQAEDGADTNQVKINFPEMTYDQKDIGSTYTYTITERTSSGSGITKDTGTYEVEVAISDAGKGKLNVTPTYYKVSGSNRTKLTGTAASANFINRYNASGTKSLQATKTMKNHAVSASKFSFTITEYTDNTFKKEKTTVTNPVSSGKNGSIAKGSSGTFTFSSLSYKVTTDESGTITVDDRGSHYYVVKETLPSDTENKEDGYVFDTREYKIRVDVTDQKNGTLTAKAYDITKGDTASAPEITDAKTLSFTNSYEAEGEVTLSGLKTMDYKAIGEGDFTVLVTEYTTTGRTTVKQVDGKNITYTQSIPAGALKLAESKTASSNWSLTIPYAVNDDQDDRGYHYYTVTEVIPTKDALKGITYSTSTYNVTVNVTDQNDGTLKTSVTSGSQNGINFKNTYSATGDYTISGTKTLVGRQLKAGEFTFEVAVSRKAPTKGSAVEKVRTFTASNGADGKINFPKQNYSQADIGFTYTYEVTERKGSLGGITYDGTSYTIEVAITDAGDGKLDATPTYYQGTGSTKKKITTLSADFVNQYNASHEVELRADKLLHGRTIGNAQFSFQVYEGKTLVASGKNDASGNVTFAPTLTFKIDSTDPEHVVDQTGTHTYTVKEEVPAQKANGYTYDTYEYTVTLEIKDNGDGTLAVNKATGLTRQSGSTTAKSVYRLNAKTGRTKDFVNLYNAKTELTIKADKLLQGRALAKDQFSFVIEEKDSKGAWTVVATGSNAADADFDLDKSQSNPGEIVFTKLTYAIETTEEKGETRNDMGTHTYRVKEVAEDQSGYTYDDAVIEFTVKAEDLDNGQVKLTVQEKNKSAATLTGDQDTPLSYTLTTKEKGKKNANFINRYDAENVLRVSADKLLQGRAQQEGEFTFGIYEVDAKGNIGKTPVATASGKADSSFADPERTSAAQSFTFSDLRYFIESKEDGSGFTHNLGTHSYVVLEIVEQKKDGYTYDRTTKDTGIDFTVKAEDQDNGVIKLTLTEDGQDSVSSTDTLTYTLKTQTEDAANFVNLYNAVNTLTFTADKLLQGHDLAQGQFSFGIFEEIDGVLSDTPVVSRDVTKDPATETDVTADNEADGDAGTGTFDTEGTYGKGSITFPEMTYYIHTTATSSEHNLGTHVYVIKEMIPDTKAGGYTYDETGIKVSVTAKDLDNGVIELTVQEDGQEAQVFTKPATYALATTQEASYGAAADGSAKTQSGVFVNTYEAKGEITFEGTKVLLARAEKLKDKEFTFSMTETQIVGADGKTMKETRRSWDDISNDADGKIEFPTITYVKNKDADQTGTYEYVITEQAPDNDLRLKDGVTYDDASFKIMVVVTDDNAGKLKAEATYDDGDVDFVNTYFAEEFVTFEADKLLLGRHMLADQFEFGIFEVIDGAEAKEPISVGRNAVDEDSAQTGNFHDAGDRQEGRIVFDPIRYYVESEKPDQVDTYIGERHYIVREIIPADQVGGYTYDSEGYPITVVVTDNSDGTLTVEVTEGAALKETEDLELPDVTVASVDPGRKVTLAASAADEDPRKTPLCPVYEITVPEGKEKNFVNEYEAKGSITFEGDKTLLGRTLDEGEFTFDVVEYQLVDGEPVETGRTFTGTNTAGGEDAGKDAEEAANEAAEPADGQEGGQTGENEGGAASVAEGTGADTGLRNNQIVFETIDYLKDQNVNQTGSYLYIVSERTPDGETVTDDNGVERIKKDGVLYSKETYEIKLTVTDEGNLTGDDGDAFDQEPAENTDGYGNGRLKVTVDTVTYKIDGNVISETGSQKELHFTNEYEAFGDSMLQVRKEMRDKNGKIYEGLDPEDTYFGFTFDFEVYEVGEAKVTNPPAAQEETAGEDDASAQEGASSADGESAGEEGGVSEDPAAADENVADGGSNEGETDQAARSETLLETISTTGNTLGMFAPFAYEQSKRIEDDGMTHTYRVVEKAGNLPGFTYDTTRYLVEISITDNRDGTLTAKQTLIATDAGSEETQSAAEGETSGLDIEPVLFTNSYDANGSITLEGTKTVQNLKLVMDELQEGMFTFTVTEKVKGEVTTVATGYNDEKGRILFTEIPYTWDDRGTHTYTITEDQTNVIAGIMYDETPVKVKVTVTDAGDGTLEAEAAYTKGGVDKEDAQFVNSAGTTDLYGNKGPGTEDHWTDKTQTGQKQTETESEKDKAPRTSDDTPLMPLVTMLFASLLLMVALFLRKLQKRGII